MTDIEIPHAYKRGSNVLYELGEFCQKRAKKVFVIGGQHALDAVKDRVLSGLQKYDLDVVGLERYGGECTWNNITQLAQQAKANKADLLVAIGGGKVLDTGKAVAYMNGIPCVTVPTIAATCAAFTPLSVIYDEGGFFLENSTKSACPVAVFADTDIIVNAPAKWLFSGMGDTLAKWYELRATTSSTPVTSRTIGGSTNGRICYDIIKEFGPRAKEAVESKCSNTAFEYVIDAIILYAGMSSILGGDKLRGAASHSLYFGFTNIPRLHGFGHGLLVGFGNLCLLDLENRSEYEILEEIRLAQECGIPIRLSQIGKFSEEDLKMIAQVAITKKGIENMAMDITVDMLIKSIKRIDELSKDNF
ncbi:MAG TPA: iron-containing alcohol dehydrogenase family protein [Desulfosporosinus sp.]|nr:iron-containing alcohol dehydrogenase family protein [Desulfosporosinus sp.]